MGPGFAQHYGGIFPCCISSPFSCGILAAVAPPGLSWESFCPSGALFSLSMSCGVWADVDCRAEEGGWNLSSSQTAKTKPRGKSLCE